MRSAVFLVTVVAVAAATAAKVPGSTLGIGHSLKAALKNAEPLFNSHFLQGSEASPVMTLSMSTKSALKDVFFQPSSDTDVLLSGIHVVAAPRLTVTSASADLQYLNLAVEGSVGTVVIDGNYSVASRSILKMLPAVSEGKFSVALKSVSFKGRTGLKISGDSLVTHNYDIDYSPADVIIMVEYDTPNGHVTSQVSTKFIDVELVGKFKARLQYLMNTHLQRQFDSVLTEYSLNELLLDDEKVVTSFRSHARTITANANEYVDAVLANLAQLVRQAGAESLQIPTELHGSFSEVILWITWHGSFTANQGWAKNLATVQRTGDISISYEGGVVTVFGSLGLGELQVGFDHYHVEFMDIGPSGVLIATVGSNSLFLKVSVDLLHAATATVQQLNVEYVDNIDLDVTGLGILNWLVSLIATWVLGFFNDTVVSLVNQQLQGFAATSVSLVDAALYFY